MPITQAIKKDTKTAIMDAAEIVMAEHGVDGASIRAIVTKAGANTAAIHYHFNSRDGLIEAMLGRHGGSVSQRRSEMFAEFDCTGRAPTTMDVVNLLVDPMIELLDQKGEAGRRFLCFIARLQFDRKNQSNRTGLHSQEERKYFPELRAQLLDIIRQACPEISETESEERLTMVLDTMLQSFSNAEFMSTEWEADEQHHELFRYTANLKSFLAGGLAAPVPRK
ncbi:MAG: TetR/AcrR family transcriptional regulator [Candidatus Hydrogenedentota bacterium]|jgi:AcrR family transcriptional regulator